MLPDLMIRITIAKKSSEDHDEGDRRDSRLIVHGVRLEVRLTFRSIFKGEDPLIDICDSCVKITKVRF